MKKKQNVFELRNQASVSVSDVNRQQTYLKVLNKMATACEL